MTDIKDPQHLFKLILSTLLIGNLEDKGFIEGPFTVDNEKCYATVKLLHATEDVEIPPRDELVDMAFGLMEVSGKNGMSEEDAVGIRWLLENSAELDLSWAE